MSLPARKPSLFSTLLAPLTGADRLATEKSRLEAFLNAFPGEYCGFHDDGSVAYSEGFQELLGLSAIRAVEDIQAALKPGDAAALEGQFLALETEGRAFTLTVSTEGGLILRLRGSAGAALDGSDRFVILWAENITEETDKHEAIRLARESAERELGIMKGGLDHLPLPVWLRGADLDLLWVNKAYAALVGTVPADAAASQLELVLVAKSQSRRPKDLARDAVTEGRPQSARVHAIIGGQRHLMDIEERPLPGTANTVGIAKDLTREEEIGAELERHRAANKTLLEQLRSAIAIFSAGQDLEFFNSAFAQQWGLSEQWLNTRPKLGDILEKLREDRRLPEQTDFRKYKQGWLDMFTRLIDPHEEMMYLPDGSAVRLLVVPHPMGGLMMTFEDVTSRLELESSYNTLIAVQKETLDNLAEGVAVYGSDGRLRLSNPSFAKLWDLTPEEIQGEPHISRMVERMLEQFVPDEQADMRRVLTSHGLNREIREGRLIRTDGVIMRFATVPLPDGGVMVSYYDITDSARIENVLREKNAALEAAEQLKTDFLANVSYQFRTPLNAIMGFSEILENKYFGDMNQRQLEYASGIRESGERLISLIDDILDLSTIEAGYFELKTTTLSLQTVLSDLHKLTIDWGRKQGVTIRLDVSDNVSFNGDERRIKQAVLNLIRNAINFTPNGGSVTLEGRKNGDGIVIAVTDTGVGIAAEQLARLFQPFERHQTGEGSHSGAGLGLTLVKNIIELHGGSVSLASNKGQGTTAKIMLPLSGRLPSASS